VARNAANFAGEDVEGAPTDGKFCADGLGGERLHQMQKSSGWFFLHRNKPRLRHLPCSPHLTVPTVLLTKKSGGEPPNVRCWR
jgi:hypothetical protein